MKTDMNFFFVVFGADVPRRPEQWQRAEPILAGDVGNVFHHFEDAFAGTSFT